MNPESPSTHKRLHALVHGRVQGVSFRWYTRQRAAELGLTGWVRNLRGCRSVEVLAEGFQEQLQEMIFFLHKGSPGAMVENVELQWMPATREFSEFNIRFL